MTSPIRPTDDEARKLARALLSEARFCALAVLDDTGAPVTSRIAIGQSDLSAPVALISQLSLHTQAIRRDPRCSLLVGEPGDKGDPLNHPRLTLQAKAQMVERGTSDFERLQNRWLESHPKSKLYIGFADFLFARFEVHAGFLNGGFGQAFQISAKDMGLMTAP